MKKLIASVFFGRWTQKYFIIFLALVSSLAGLLTPYVQKVFLAQFEYRDLLISAALMLVSFVSYQMTIYYSQLEALKAQEKLSELVYRHVIALTSFSKAHRTTGELVALYTTDVPSATMWLEQTLPYVLTTFLPLLVTPIFLNVLYAVPVGHSVLLILTILVVNFLMARRQSVFFSKFKLLAADRISLVNEWLQNIKSLRLLGWTESFEKRILRKRVVETENRISMVTNGQLMNSFSSSITFWLNLLILLYFLSLGRNTGAAVHRSDVLLLIWVVGVFLSRPFRQLPWLLTMFFDALTSLRRVNALLEIKNVEPLITSERHADDLLLHIKDLNLSINGKGILHHLNLDVKRGELVSIVGPVGSGKSMLLKSIIGETPFRAEEFFSESVGYLPQEPFIFSSTVHNNLSFEYEKDYNLDESMNSLDLAHFTHLGQNEDYLLRTVVGERGLNLSGGQKQRLHLARLFYNRQKVYLLDDPFSAIDVNTELKIIDSILRLRAEGHSFIIVSQRYSFLKYSDRVVHMENGRINFTGTFEEFASNYEI